MYRAPHGYSWGSFVMGINCDTRNALRSAWQRALSLNMVSSARIPCGLTINDTALGDLYHLPVILVQSVSYTNEIFDVA